MHRLLKKRRPIPTSTGIRALQQHSNRPLQPYHGPWPPTAPADGRRLKHPSGDILAAPLGARFLPWVRPVHRLDPHKGIARVVRERHRQVHDADEVFQRLHTPEGGVDFAEVRIRSRRRFIPENGETDPGDAAELAVSILELVSVQNIQRSWGRVPVGNKNAVTE